MKKLAFVLLAVFVCVVIADAQTVRVRSRKPKAPPDPLQVERIWWTVQTEQRPTTVRITDAEGAYRARLRRAANPPAMWAMVNGTLKNNTDTTYERITVTIGVYYAGGKERIGAATASTDSLPPGKVWSFTAMPGANYPPAMRRYPPDKCFAAIVEKVDGTPVKPKEPEK